MLIVDVDITRGEQSAQTFVLEPLQVPVRR